MLLKMRFNSIKLGAKFNALLTLAFFISIALSGVMLSTILEQRAQAEVTSQANLLMQTVTSLRDYTQDRVNPLLQNQIENGVAFIPESIPSFSVREVIDRLQKNQDYRNFSYKDATLDPTNLRDKADDFEVELIDRFRKHPEIKELSGYRALPEGTIFYIAKPLAITDQKCLQCHSNPAVAPKTMLTSYGSEHGFNWKLNDILAAQVVSIPSETVFENASHSFLIIMGTLVGIFLIVILLINLLLRRTVVQRIRRIAKTAQAASMGEMNVELEEHSSDEIGTLATAFDRLKSSLEIAMDLLKKQKE